MILYQYFSYSNCLENFSGSNSASKKCQVQKSHKFILGGGGSFPLYSLYIRSVLEYCSVLWHSTLTVDQSERIENVQKTCRKIILGSEYDGYTKALEYCALKPLSERREDRCLQFGLKCLLHAIHHRMFPVNLKLQTDTLFTRNKEHFTVNKAKSESYRMSAIPYIQRMLNEYVQNQKRQWVA